MELRRYLLEEVYGTGCAEVLLYRTLASACHAPDATDATEGTDVKECKTIKRCSPGCSTTTMARWLSRPNMGLCPMVGGGWRAQPP
jgi:hypothetical protein